jgi:hypothetical protein
VGFTIIKITNFFNLWEETLSKVDKKNAKEQLSPFFADISKDSLYFPFGLLFTNALDPFCKTQVQSPQTILAVIFSVAAVFGGIPRWKSTGTKYFLGFPTCQGRRATLVSPL